MNVANANANTRENQHTEMFFFVTDIKMSVCMFCNWPFLLEEMC